MYNQHTRGMAPNRHRSLVEGGGRKAFARDKERPSAPKKKGGGGKGHKKNEIQKSQEKDLNT